MTRWLIGFFVVCFCVIATEGYRYFPEICDWLQHGSDGQIIVNSPNIYTRQRLVNDRLTQTRWLEDQLKIADKAVSPYFKSIDQVYISANDQSLILKGGANLTAPSTASAEERSAAKSDKQPSEKPTDQQKAIPAPVHVESTTAALFRAKNAFREEVRSEMTQTQLDDRHDILGNTIYRLAFDATIIAGSRPNSLAVVRIALSHNFPEIVPATAVTPGGAGTYGNPPDAPASPQVQPSSSSDANRKSDAAATSVTPGSLVPRGSPPAGPASTQAQPASTPCTNPNSDANNGKVAFEFRRTMNCLYEDDYERLYLDWVRYIQKVISSSVDDTAAALPTTNADQRFQLMFAKFLHQRLCELVAGKTDLRDAADYDCEDASERDMVARKLYETYIKNRFEHYESVLRSVFEEGVNKLKRSGYDFSDYKADDLYRSARDTCKSSGGQAAISVSDLYVRNPKNPNAPADAQLSCPFYSSPAQFFIAGSLLYSEFYKYVTDLTPEKRKTTLPQTLVDNFQTKREAAERACVENKLKSFDNKSKNVENRSKSVANKPQDVENKPGCPWELDQAAAFRCFAADFVKANLTAYNALKPEPWQRIGRFLHFDIVGREANNCSILVSRLTPKTGVGAEEYEPVKELTYHLNKRTEAYSYSVTPKNLSENISTATDTRDAFELLLRYGSDDKESSNIISGLRSRSDRLQAILAHPIVVGFGSGSAAPELLQYKDLKSPSVRKTIFGWVVAPRQHGDRDLEQISGQYSLTAVISVPSWWRSVELEIETCWIPPTEVGHIFKSQKFFAEACGQRKEDPMVIRLPGAIPEISRKLGFEVVQEPNILGETKQTAQQLDIGQPGSLLLKGSRLWRSTEVMLGAQRATSITVLPDMEGIIAQFDCVLPQTPLKPGTPSVIRTSVTVWTSEGSTAPIPVDLVWPPAKTAGPSPERAVAHPNTKGKQSPAGEIKLASNTPATPAQAGNGGPDAKQNSRADETIKLSGEKPPNADSPPSSNWPDRCGNRPDADAKTSPYNSYLSR